MKELSNEKSETHVKIGSSEIYNSQLIPMFWLHRQPSSGEVIPFILQANEVSTN